MNDLALRIQDAQTSADQLSELPARYRNGVVNALKEAHQAAQANDNEWLLDELKRAIDILAQYRSVALAHQLAEAITALIQQAEGKQPAATHNQQISGNAQVGTAISGNVYGPVTNQSSGVNYGSGNTINHTGDVVAGDKFSGDKVAGDKHVYNNQGPNQGAQGVFHGPVTFNQGSAQPAEPRRSNVQGSPSHLQTMLRIKTRRLEELEKQAGYNGPNTRPEVLMEMDELREEIANIKQQLGE